MSRGQENFIYNSGVVNTGDNNNINNAQGSGIRQENTCTVMPAGGQDAWEQLAEELARIHQRLAEGRGNSVAAVDLDDALVSVEAAQENSSATGNASPEARRGMRLRVKGLIGILAPVAEIVGGVAALEAICQHL